MKRQDKEKKETAPVGAEVQTAIVAAGAAGFRPGKIAEDFNVARRDVRAMLRAARNEDAEGYERLGEQVRRRAMARIDGLIDEGSAFLYDRGLEGIKPEQLSRILANLARVRRDLGDAASSATLVRPAALPEAPVLVRESEDEWNARHAGSSSAVPGEAG